MPLGFSGHGGIQIISGTQVGAQLRGGIPAGAMKFNYSVYLSNGPALNVDAAEPAPAAGGLYGNIQNEENGAGPASGTLNYANIPDNNGNKAVGGRIGFLPIPEMEIGVSFENATVGAGDSEYSDVGATTTSFDFSYVGDVSFLAGRLDLKAQSVWLNIDNPNVDHLNFENKSNAFYAQAAYQPYNVSAEFLQDFEFVARYDQIDLPSGSEFGLDQSRITGGINYWINHSSVLKFAYQSTTSKYDEGDVTDNGFTLQMSMGF